MWGIQDSQFFTAYARSRAAPQQEMPPLPGHAQRCPAIRNGVPASISGEYVADWRRPSSSKCLARATAGINIANIERRRPILLDSSRKFCSTVVYHGRAAPCCICEEGRVTPAVIFARRWKTASIFVELDTLPYHARRTRCSVQTTRTRYRRLLNSAWQLVPSRCRAACPHPACPACWRAVHDAFRA